MAFNIKFAEENYFNALPSNITDSFLREDFNNNHARFETLSQHFAFALSQAQRIYLNECGIQLAPIASRTHPHPVSKTIENHLLFSVVSHLIQNFKYIAFMSIKRSKAEYLWRRIDCEAETILANRILDIKDMFRYDSDSVISGGHNNFSLFCHNLARRLCVGRLRPDCYFFHDELHYWTSSNLCEFLFKLRPKCVLATIVIPPELLVGLQSSYNSVAYSFRVVGETLFFFPDGSKGKPYQQPADCWLLKCNGISFFDQGEMVNYSIGIIESIGANHLISIQQSKVCESVRFFKDFDCLDVRALTPINVEHKVHHGSLIRSWVFRKILSYIVCLKKGDTESSLAKLRQLCDSNPIPEELLLIGDFFDLLTRVKIFNKRSPWSVLSEVKNYVDSWVIKSPFLRRIFPVGSRAITEMIREWISLAAPLEITVDCETLFFDDSFIVQSTGSSFFTPLLKSVAPISSTIDKAFSLAEKVLSFSWLNDRKTSFYSFKQHLGMLIHTDKLSSETIEDCFLHLIHHSRACHTDQVINSFEPVWDYILGVYIPNHLQRRISYSAENGDMSSIEVKVPEPTLSESKAIVTTTKCDEETSELKAVTNEPHSSNDIEVIPFKSRQNACFFIAVGETMKIDPEILLNRVMYSDSPSLDGARKQILLDNPLGSKVLDNCAIFLGLRIHIYYADSIIKLNDCPDMHPIDIGGRPGHLFSLVKSGSKEVISSIGSHSAGPQAIIGKVYSKVYGLGSDAFSSLSCLNLQKILTLIESFESMNFGLRVDRKSIKDGKLLSAEMLKHIKNLRSKGVDKVHFQSIPVYPFIGFAGSGKSHALTEELINGDLKQEFIFTAPRRKIIDQIHDRINSRQYEEKLKVSKRNSFSTFENTLLKPVNKTFVIVDECSLNPPGFIELLILKSIDGAIKVKADIPKILSHQALSGEVSSSVKSPIACIAVTGDILQSGFYSESCSKLMKFGNDLKEICKTSFMQLPYLFGSRRFGQSDNCITLGFYGEHTTKVNKMDDMEALKRAMGDKKDRFGVIVTSRADKSNFELDFPDVMTINESQGSTFDGVVLIVSRDFFSNPIEAVIVACTRHRKHLVIFFPKSIQAELDYLCKRYPIHSNVIMKNFDVLDASISERLSSFNLVTELPFGHNFEIKLEGDPFLKSELSLVQPIQVESVIEEQVIMKENLKTHMPIAFDGAWDLQISEMRSRESREFRKERVGWSHQFKDEPNSKDIAKLNSAMLPEAVFPRHFANDDLTFWSAVKKRLIFKDPLRNAHDFEKSKVIGKDLLKVFLKHVPIKPEFNKKMYEDSVEEFEDKKISKNASMIGAHHGRSTTDWPINEIFLFIKSQLCTKSEKMFCDAKAGQTLACFSHLILCKFAPLNRYIEKKVSEVLPQNFYIHQKKNFEELEAWVMNYKFDGYCTESDYEAYDASQDAYTLSFEYELMRYLGVSNSLIDDYLFLKMHLCCKLGNLAIMRFTGEFCTFLFNTLTNMLFTFLKYDVRKSHAICFAGDDMCANTRLPDNPNFKAMLKNFSLKAKVQFTKNPTFCGWNLSKYGIVKKPELIAARLAVAQQKQEVHLVIDSYYLEHSFAYTKGDLLFEILSESELEHHYNLTRFFVKHSNQLKGLAKERYLEARSIEGGLFGECSFGSVKLAKILISESVITVGKCFIKGVKKAITELAIHEADNLLNDLNAKMMEKENAFFSNQRGFKGSEMMQWDDKLNKGFKIQEFEKSLHHQYRKFFLNSTVGIKTPRTEGIRAILGQDTERGLKLSGIKDIKISRCPLFQSGNFSAKQTSQMVTESSLIQCMLKTSTVMRMPSTKEPSLLSSDSNPLLQCRLVVQGSQILSNLISLMRLKLKKYERWPASMLCSTSELCSYLSLAFSNLNNQCREGLYIMIQDFWTSMRPAKLDSALAFSQDLLSFCTGQIIQSLPLIQTSCGLLESSLSLIKSKLLTTHISSLLTSVSCINLAINQQWSRLQVLKQVLSFRRFLGQQIFPTLSLIWRMRISLPHHLLHSLTLAWIKASKKVVSLRVHQDQPEPEDIMPNPEDKGQNSLTEPQRCQEKDQVQADWIAWLGQVLTGVKIFRKQIVQDTLCTKILKTTSGPQQKLKKSIMSIVEQLQNQIKRELGDYIWEQIIDRPNNLMMTAVAAVPATEGVVARAAVDPSEQQLVTKSRILSHYLSYLFGNLAILGTSEMTEYPTVRLEIPRPTIEGQAEITQYLPTSISLLEFVQIVKAWGAVGAGTRFRNYKLRALCEPFARQAYAFFRDNKTLASNIYLKNPGSYFDCPAVVFDFNKGLPLDIIRQGKNALAISACNQRLLNREGKKAVFAAQGEVNLSFDS
ncbi:polyprotein [Mume virus A]|uniref:Polyprotein n=1 Tax=Mume virus A TaxID=2137858 RepID=A0A2R3ZVF1_9VIRU|nr:polyprotein [Mume virus A]AVR54644.1 polyprotein [Mume virus A]